MIAAVLTKRDENESDESAWIPTEQWSEAQEVEKAVKALKKGGTLLVVGVAIYVAVIGYTEIREEHGEEIREVIDEVRRVYINCDKLQEAIELDSLCLESTGCSMTREELSASKERVEKWVSSCVEE